MLLVEDKTLQSKLILPVQASGLLDTWAVSSIQVQLQILLQIGSSICRHDHQTLLIPFPFQLEFLNSPEIFSASFGGRGTPETSHGMKVIHPNLNAGRK